MNVKEVNEKIEHIVDMKAKLEKIIKSTEDMETWDFFNEIDFEFSEYIKFLKSAVERAKVNI